MFWGRARVARAWDGVRTGIVGRVPKGVTWGGLVREREQREDGVGDGHGGHLFLSTYNVFCAFAKHLTRDQAMSGVKAMGVGRSAVRRYRRSIDLT